MNHIFCILENTVFVIRLGFSWAAALWHDTGGARPLPATEEENTRFTFFVFLEVLLPFLFCLLRPVLPLPPTRFGFGAFQTRGVCLS